MEVAESGRPNQTVKAERASWERQHLSSPGRPGGSVPGRQSGLSKDPEV